MQQYGDKYSGRLATYTANRVPMAIYSNAANKTFFVYGGAKQGKRYLLDMIAYYDHARGVVPRPTIVYDKQATAFAQRRATPWLPKASATPSFGLTGHPFACPASPIAPAAPRSIALRVPPAVTQRRARFHVMVA